MPNPGIKKAPWRGPDLPSISGLGGGGRVHGGLGSPCSAFVQYFLGKAGATTAAGAYTEAFAKLIQVVGAPSGRAADLLVGDGFTDTDIHNQ